MFRRTLGTLQRHTQLVPVCSFLSEIHMSTCTCNAPMIWSRSVEIVVFLVIASPSRPASEFNRRACKGPRALQKAKLYYKPILHVEADELAITMLVKHSFPARRSCLQLSILTWSRWWEREERLYIHITCIGHLLAAKLHAHMYHIRK